MQTKVNKKIPTCYKVWLYGELIFSWADIVIAVSWEAFLLPECIEGGLHGMDLTKVKLFKVPVESTLAVLVLLRVYYP